MFTVLFLVKLCFLLIKNNSLTATIFCILCIYHQLSLKLFLNSVSSQCILNTLSVWWISSSWWFQLNFQLFWLVSINTGFSFCSFIFHVRTLPHQTKDFFPLCWVLLPYSIHSLFFTLCFWLHIFCQVTSWKRVVGM